MEASLHVTAVSIEATRLDVVLPSQHSGARRQQASELLRLTTDVFRITLDYVET